MQHIHLHHPQLHFRIPSRMRLLELALFSIAVTLFTTYALQASSRTIHSPAMPRNPNQLSGQTAPQGAKNDSTNTAESAKSDSLFERNARELAATDSPEAYRDLLSGLRQSETLSHRDVTVALLINASDKVVPVLEQALTDADAGVRAGAAQILGLRHEYRSVAALMAATHDPAARVRAEAATALGEIYAWQALPRLAQLQVNEGNLDVRQAAHSAVAIIQVQVAKELGMPAHRILDVSVTTSNPPQLYLVTGNSLYARDGTIWNYVSRLPDAPLALATGSEVNILYLSTANSGLYRSLDGGSTWEYVEFGLNTSTKLTMTAIAVDPGDSRRVFAALASPGAEPGKLDPLGISVSLDSGTTWYQLEESPMYAVTTRLVLDPEWPSYLFGIAEETPWRYTLPSNAYKSQ